MDRTATQGFLELAEAHVSLGKRHIEKQLLLIASLERDSQDTTKERAFLEELYAQQAEHEAHRDRLKRELES
jgi:hypothetical protein